MEKISYQKPPKSNTINNIKKTPDTINTFKNNTFSTDHRNSGEKYIKSDIIVNKSSSRNHSRENYNNNHPSNENIFQNN